MNISPQETHDRKKLKAIWLQVLSLLEPPLALSIWAWAELRRRIGRDVTAKAGPYRTALTPYQREPQESFTDSVVQTTVLYWAKRLGKTECLMNAIGATIEQNPRNILVVYPTLDSAQKWSKQFFTPMVRATPVLRSKIHSEKTRDINNTILSKRFPGGTISAIGSNSPSGFRQVQAPVVICDEIDAMEDGPEGDPVTLAFGRAENYPDSIQVVSSTATRIFKKSKDGQQTEGSRIHSWWLKSDQRKWFVPCHACQKSHVLTWSQVKWLKVNGEHDFESAYYECPDCLAKWDDKQRVATVLAGEWRATAPFKGIRGYWLNGINTTFPAKKGFKTKLHQMAKEFYDAYKGGEAALITWKNTFLCEPHEESAETLDPEPLLQGCEAYPNGLIPTAVELISCAVDVQIDRLECELIGMGEDEETWGIEAFSIGGNPERGEVWKKLAEKLAGKHKREDGVELPITCTAIDLGFRPASVRKFIRTCGLTRVYGVYGAATKQTTLVVPRFNKHYRMFSYSVNTELAKDTLFARLKLKEPGPRYMHFPQGRGYDRDYFDGLTAEEVRIKFKNGFPHRYYEKIRPRNEPLDLRVYFLAAMDILKPNIEAIKKGRMNERKTYELQPVTKQPANLLDPPPTPLDKPKRGKRFRMGGGFGI